MRFRPMHPLVLSLAACCLTAGAHAQSGNQHVDVNPYDSNGADPGGQILTGFYDFDTETFVQDASVFIEPLEILQSSFHGVSAPGFFASGDFTLLPSTDMSFDIPAVADPIGDTPSTLFYWDGVDDDEDGDFLEDVEFGEAPAGHSLEVRLSRFVNMSVAGESTDQPGFVLDRTNGSGGVHKHVSFLVRGDAGNAPDDGFYLLPFRLHQDGLESSDPFYLLFNGKYERDESDNIIFNGILPVVEDDPQAAAQTWLEAALAAGLPGDYDASGQVEQGDLDIVLQNWGTGTFTGDEAALVDGGPFDGTVDQNELDGVLQNWGSTSAPDFVASAVPEPTTGLLLGVGAWLASRRGRTA